jgi:phage-related protein
MKDKLWSVVNKYQGVWSAGSTNHIEVLFPTVEASRAAVENLKEYRVVEGSDTFMWDSPMSKRTIRVYFSKKNLHWET